MAQDSAVVCISNLEEYARKHLPKFAFAHYAAGAMDGDTVRENQNAFKRLQVYPRVLRGISQVDMSTSVLGQPISMPICVAPTASHEMAHPEAEIATARGAQAAQTLMGLSCFASKKIAVVADGAPGGLLWMQMNIFCDRQVNLKIARAAEQNGFKALMVTVDTGVVGHKYSDFRDKDQLYGHLTYPNLNFATMKDGSADYLPAMAAMDFRAGWDFIDWLKKETKLPIVVKGILTAEDAVLAIEHGVQGIVVSNHGGRQLDTVPATIGVLPEIVRAVQGRVEVYLDGGVRLGTDVFKALALGARAVFVGRPALWGLAYQGEQGVLKMLEILREELKVTMILAGCETLSDIKASMVSKFPYYSRL